MYYFNVVGINNFFIYIYLAKNFEENIPCTERNLTQITERDERYFNCSFLNVT
jgi:hypothetical protein